MCSAESLTGRTYKILNGTSAPKMANHRGSFFLKRVLQILDSHGLLDSPQAQKAVQEVVTYACEEQDCNSSAVLEDIGARLGLCHACNQAAPQLSRGGLCLSCLEKM